MSLNLDPPKQVQEVFFSVKSKKPNHPDLIFDNNLVIQSPYQKHLSIFSDDKSNFGELLKYIVNKVKKSIGLLHKRQILLPRRSLVILYKSFITPHFDYRDVIFGQTKNKPFYESLVSLMLQCFVSYNWCNKRFIKLFDSLNEIGSCGLETEITCHHLLQCFNIINERTLLLSNASIPTISSIFNNS